MLTLAVWRLRAVSRRLDSGPRLRVRRARRRPPVGDDAMLWKELYATGRGSGWGKFILLPTAFSRPGRLVLRLLRLSTRSLTGISAGITTPPAGSSSIHGYRFGPDARVRLGPSSFQRILARRLFLLPSSSPWLIAVAAVSASGVTTERERGDLDRPARLAALDGRDRPRRSSSARPGA